MVSDLDSIDWDVPSVFLTHGWNDYIVDPTPASQQDAANHFEQHFTTAFARNCDLQDHDNALSPNFQIFAVDWWNDGQSNGSDPNGRTEEGLEVVLGLVDAIQSANNGIAAAKPLAESLVTAGLRPELTMFVGHSNGAGFGGSFAKTVFDATGGHKIKELVALDAPIFTPSYRETLSAAPYVDTLSNYYQPMIQSDDEPEDYLWDLALNRFGIKGWILKYAIDSIDDSKSKSVGAPMGVWNSNVINYEFDIDVSDMWYPHVQGHTQVPLRYAQSAHPTAFETPWGFQASPLVARTNPERTAFIMRELEPQTNYLYDGYGGTFEPSTTLRSLVWGQVVEGISSAAFAVTDEIVSIWNAGVRQADSLEDALFGVNARITHVEGGGFGGSGAGGSWEPFYECTARSPVYASVDVRVPESASTLQFDLSVVDPGNEDVLLVAIGNDVIGEVDLDKAYLTDGASIIFSLDGHAGETTKLDFYMPSDTSSNASFYISNVVFGSMQTAIVVNSLADGPVDHSNNDSELTLRDALDLARNNPNDDIVRFADGLAGTIALTEGELEYNLFDGTDGGDLTINGPAKDLIEIDAQGLSRVFVVDSAIVGLVGLTITGGDAQDYQGGGLLVRRSTVSLRDVSIERNRSGDNGYGGGIYAWRSEISVQRSTITNNETGFNGGGLMAWSSTISIQDSTISANLASYGGESGVKTAVLTSRIRYSQKTKWSRMVSSVLWVEVSMLDPAL